MSVHCATATTATLTFEFPALPFLFHGSNGHVERQSEQALLLGKHGPELCLLLLKVLQLGLKAVVAKQPEDMSECTP